MMAMNCWQTVEMCDKMLQRVQVSRVFQSVEVCATVSAWAELLFLGVSRPLLTMTKPCHTMLVLDHTAFPLPQQPHHRILEGTQGVSSVSGPLQGLALLSPHWSTHYSLHLRRGEPIVFTCPSVAPHPTVQCTHVLRLENIVGASEHLTPPVTLLTRAIARITS